MFTVATAKVAKFAGATAGSITNGMMKVFLWTTGIYVAIYIVMKILGFQTAFHIQMFGIPVEISMLSAIIVFMFVVDGIAYISAHHLGLANHSLFFVGVIVSIVVVASVFFHELSHALVAASLGSHVEFAGISWWGAFVGWSTGLEEISPLGQMWIALAGPFSNLVIFLIGAIVVAIFGESLFENAVQYIAVANLRLGLLNLIPFFVLDGGKFVDGFLRLFIADDMWRLFLVSVVFGFVWGFRKELGSVKNQLEKLLAVI